MRIYFFCCCCKFCINEFHSVLHYDIILLYFCICLDRFSKNSIFRIRSNVTFYITQLMLGQVVYGSNDINKLYRNFFWLKFKVTLQDTQNFCSKQIRIIQLTNVTVREIPPRRGQLYCDHQKFNLLNKTLQGNSTLHLCLFLKQNHGFHYCLLFLLSLNLFVRIFFLKETRNSFKKRPLNL